MNGRGCSAFIFSVHISPSVSKLPSRDKVNDNHLEENFNYIPGDTFFFSLHE